MSIQIKAIFCSITLIFIVGVIVTCLLWLCLEEINHNHIFIIAILTSVIAPRYEVISSQSGKSLKLTGIFILIYNALKDCKKQTNYK